MLVVWMVAKKVAYLVVEKVDMMAYERVGLKVECLVFVMVEKMVEKSGVMMELN